MSKTLLIIILLIFVIPVSVFAIGVNLSYFLPLPLETGYLGIPVPPLNFSSDLLSIVPKIVNIGFDVGLMFMPGYSLAGLGALKLTAPPLGPSTAFEFGLNLKLSLPVDRFTLSAIGGGFTYYYFDLKFNKGNFDRDLMAYMNWNSLTSDLQIVNNWGFGYKFGGAFSVEIMPKISVNLKGIYYYGEAPAPVTGKITGGTATIGTQDFSLNEAKTLYAGVKMTIGGSYEL